MFDAYYNYVNVSNISMVENSYNNGCEINGQLHNEKGFYPQDMNQFDTSYQKDVKEKKEKTVHVLRMSYQSP